MEGIALMYQAKILLNEGYSRQRIAEILNVSVRTVYNYEHDLVFDSGAPAAVLPEKANSAPFTDSSMQNLKRILQPMLNYFSRNSAIVGTMEK